MRVINVDQNGNEIDLAKTVVPLSSAAYNVCKDVFIREGSNDRRSNKDTKEKTDA